MLLITCPVVLILTLAGAGLFIWYKNSPYLTAMLIRRSFDEGGRTTNAIIEKYAPKNIASITNVQYHSGDPDAKLDIYYTPNASSSAPTILWIHGGGWLAGNKEGLNPWARVLAGKGFNVVALNYSIAPEKHYPLPVIQTNAALHFLNETATTYHLDMSKFVIGGDSAGSQIAAQAALIETNPGYATAMDLSPGLKNGHIAALLLNCGPYDLSLVNQQSNSDGAQLVRAFLWAYTGKKDYLQAAKIKYASIPQYVTKDFPPSFITAGNADPLLPHSKSLVTALKKVNVTTDPLFYPTNYSPALNHEYQFNLDTKEGQTALNHMVTFTKAHTK